MPFHLLAQAAAPDAYPEFATIGGIVALTLGIVQVLKYALADVPYARKLPTWLYAVGVAAALVAVSRYVLGAMDGAIGPLIWATVKAAAAASGLHAWLTHLDKTPSDNDSPPSGSTLRVGAVALLAALLLPFAGCATSGGTTPLQQTVLARQAYTATLNNLSLARSLELIDDDQYRQIEAGRQIVADALDTAEAAAVADEPLTFREAMELVNRQLDRLIQIHLTTQEHAHGTVADPRSDAGRRGSDPSRLTADRPTAARAARPDASRDRLGEAGPTGGRGALASARARSVAVAEPCRARLAAQRLNPRRWPVGFAGRGWRGVSGPQRAVDVLTWSVHRCPIAV